MPYAIELLGCSDPQPVVRSAAAAVPDLAGLAEALAPVTIEGPDETRATIEPTSADLDGARVHVVRLPQERRADGTVTGPRAVVILDGERAADVARMLAEAIAAMAVRSTVEYHELPDGTRVLRGDATIAVV